MAALSITAGSVIPSAAATIVYNGVAAVAITAGQVLYKLSAGTLGLCAANGSAPAYKPVGIALNNAAAGQPVAYVTADPDLNIGASLAAGVPYFTSATAGGISPFADLSTGWFVTPLGVGNADNNLNFAIGGTATGAHA